MTRSMRMIRSVVSLPTCRLATRVKTATCACRIASSGPTSNGTVSSSIDTSWE